MSELIKAAERVVWFDWSSNDDDAVRAIDDLRAALAAVRPDREGWQPIATAPKDEYVLGAVAGTKVPMIAVYDEDDGWFALNGAFKNWTPTHWKPLDKPPQPNDIEQELGSATK